MKVRKIKKYWKNCDIPAKLFFDILESGRLSLLVFDEQSDLLKKPSTKTLEKAWVQIYDEFFELKNDAKMKLILKVKKKVVMLHERLRFCERCLYAITTTAFTEGQLKDLADKLRQFRIKIDPDADLQTELKRVLEVDLPSLKTDLELEIGNLEKLTKEQKYNFEDNCVTFEGFGYKIDENVSLRRYIAYERAVINKSKKIKSHARR